MPWDTFVFSCVKKSGKTTLNAALTLWWATTQEAPNELYILANDLEQAKARVFETISRLVRQNRIETKELQAKRIVLPNESSIQALSSDYLSASGSNHGLVSFDELWAFVSESSMRLVEELTPVPTRQNSVRLITTYAGFEGESRLLWDLYKAGVGKEEHPDGQGVRVHPDLPLWLNEEQRLLVFWDHRARMPWQTPAYYTTQKARLRPSAYLRLHENTWTTGESTFISAELWDPCVDPEHRPILPDAEKRGAPLFVGVDASTKNDTSAVVAVRWRGSQIELVSHKIWRPSSDNPMDLEQTVEAEIRRLWEQYRVKVVLVDPYQMHRSITTLKALGVPIEDFPQTVSSTTEMATALFDLLKGRNLRLYKDEELRQQALNTTCVESPRGMRIAKEKSSRKIDAIVALAIALVGALEKGPSVSAGFVTSMTKSFSEVLSSERLVAGEKPPESAKHSECGGRCGLNVLIHHQRAWTECPYIPNKVKRGREGTKCALPGCPSPEHRQEIVRRLRLTREDQSHLHPHERDETGDLMMPPRSFLRNVLAKTR